MAHPSMDTNRSARQSRGDTACRTNVSPRQWERHLANYLALAATTEPGDEILVEQPTYELLLSTAKYLGT